MREAPGDPMGQRSHVRTVGLSQAPSNQPGRTSLQGSPSPWSQTMIYIFNFLKNYKFFPDLHLVLFDQDKLKNNRIQMGKRESFVLHRLQCWHKPCSNSWGGGSCWERVARPEQDGELTAPAGLLTAWWREKSWSLELGHSGLVSLCDLN